MSFSSLSRWTACWTAVLALGLTTTSVWAEDPKKPETPPAPAIGSADPFAVPDTSDDRALQMFLQRLVQTQPDTPTPEAIVAHLNKIDAVVGKVLERPIGDKFYRSVVELRLQLYGVLEQVGDTTASKKRTDYLKSLSESKRPGIAELVSRFELEQRVEQLLELEESQQNALIAELIQLLRSAPQDDDEALQFAVQVSMTGVEMLQRSNSAQAVPVLKAVIAALNERKDDRLADLVANLEGTLRRLQLPGNPIEVVGQSLDGKEFNITSLKGKVVLVDFWATWCGPCIAELPHLKELHEAYRGKGFEIVGVSLDTEREELTSFVKANSINWPILFDPTSEQGIDNKIAVHYGITGLPAMILVDQNGKVVDADIHGATLDEALEKLLGPLPKPAKSEQK